MFIVSILRFKARLFVGLATLVFVLNVGYPSASTKKVCFVTVMTFLASVVFVYFGPKVFRRRLRHSRNETLAAVLVWPGILLLSCVSYYSFILARLMSSDPRTIMTLHAGSVVSMVIIGHAILAAIFLPPKQSAARIRRQQRIASMSSVHPERNGQALKNEEVKE